MSKTTGYGQFCPISMASEVLCARWTPILLRELLAGSTRFNDLRRGLPRMSPSLLSKRLKELQKADVIEIRKGAKGANEYHLTEAGEELRPLIMGLGIWGQRWVESNLSLKNLDPSLLMWDMRRRLDPRPMPVNRCTIQFLYPELKPAQRGWWLVIEHGAVDLCMHDPGFEVDLLVTASLRMMTAVWMGVTPLKTAVGNGQVQLDGDPALAHDIGAWIGLSPFVSLTERRRA